MDKYLDKTGLQDYTNKLTEKLRGVFASKAAVGAPLVASMVSGMTDTSRVYVYTGSEAGYSAGDWYYWDGADWVSGGVYNAVAVQIDDTLTEEGVAADAKAVGDALRNATGLTEDVKQALLDCFEHVAWTDEHGQDYVDALENAMYADATLVSISAVYTQSGTVYDTDSLNSLKSDLVVTALFSDYTTSTVSNYVLTGTLTEGTSTITVSYGGKTATFGVVVTSSGLPVGYTKVDYISSNVGSLGSSTPYIKDIFPTDNSDVDIIDYKVTLEFMPISLSTSGTVFGGRNVNGSTATKGIMLYARSASTSLYMGTSSSQSTLIEAMFSAFSTSEKTKWVLDGTNIYINDVLATTTTATSAVQTKDYKWALFRRNNASGGFDSPIHAKVYSFRIQDGNGADVVNLIPCKRDADNVYGMYDSVSDTFFASASSVAFTGGND